MSFCLCQMHGLWLQVGAIPWRYAQRLATITLYNSTVRQWSHNALGYGCEALGIMVQETHSIVFPYQQCLTLT